MPDTIFISYRRQGGYSATNPAGLMYSKRFGSDLRGSFNPQNFAVLYDEILTATISGPFNIDLFAHSNGELDVLNVPLVFAHVGWIYLELIPGPVTGQVMKIAPAGSNGFVGPLGTGVLIQDALDIPCGVDGFVVDGTHKLLTISNPGTADQQFRIVIGGT